MPQVNEAISWRADELFQEQQQRIYRETDRLLATLMLWQWIGAMVMALTISPFTWSGEQRAVHIHVWVSIFLGGVITIFPIWLTRVRPGAAITRYVIAVAQMLMSALLISITGGRIETHFHVFGSLVILSFYRDWRVLIPATLIVAVDHFLRGVYWPYSVYGVTTAAPWRSLEHAAWVLFEDIFLVISCFRSIKEMRIIAFEHASLEKALVGQQESERNFRSMFEASPIGVAVVGLDYRFLQVNPALCAMSGYSAEVLLQRRTSDLTYPEDLGLAQDKRQTVLAGGSFVSYEKRIVRNDGGVVWVACTASLIRNENGKPLHVLGTMENISERKRAEEKIQKLNQTLEQRVIERTEKLRSAEERYRMLFERNPEPMWVFDRETLAFLEVNQAAINRYGYSREEFLAMTIKDIRPDEELDRLLDDCRQLSDGPSKKGEIWKHRKKDGTLIDVQITADDFRWQERPARLVLAVDVTERKKAEDALRQAEQKYRTIFEDAIEGMFQATPEGKYLSANPALAKLYGYGSPEELMKVEDLEEKLYVDRRRRSEFKRLIEAKSAVQLFEYEVYCKDRSRIWVCENARAVRDEDGKILYYEGTVEDITYRKRVEEVERANRAKSEFLSRMSHELRTPLNAILGFGQLLERQNPTEKQRTRIHYIINAGQHLLNLINEVLDISRIESGKLQLSLEPVRIVDALTEAIELVRPMAAQRGIKIAVDTNLDASTHVFADRQRLKQVLLNLLTNGIKYTPGPGSVTTSYNTSAEDKVRISVSDTGPGIPEEKLAYLFTPFERLGAEHSAVEGTGLGLALSKRLVEAMRGTMGLETGVGKGSTFWIELIHTTSPAEQVGLQKHRAKEAWNGEPTPRKILYVEDNLSNLTLVEQMLEDHKQVQLLSAMQGKLGLDLARQHLPDLVLLDLHLPDLPGWDVLAQLKAQKATRHIPVVVVSADATASQIKRLMDAGAARYLTKPLDVNEFFDVLGEACGENTCAARTKRKPLEVIS